LSAAPHAAGFSAGLSAAPHAAGFSAAPHAAGFSAGLSELPHAVPQAADTAPETFLFHPNKFESAMVLDLLCLFVPIITGDTGYASTHFFVTLQKPFFLLQ
jgi:hypothetical protein